MPLAFFPGPDPTEQKYRKLARAIADKDLRPDAITDDVQCRFRRDIFNQISAKGLHALTVPKAYGGSGMGYRNHYGVMEEIGRASLSMVVTLGVTNLVQGALVTHGTEAQKDLYLRRLAGGEWLGAFSLSESGSGSDAAALRLAAKKAPGGYRLSGTKMWCSTAGMADVYLVMGRTGEHKTKGISAFLVPKETAGFRVGKQEKKLGLCASPLGELIFEDAFVPESSRVGADGEGLAVALSQLDAGRITIGNAGVAVAIEAIERAWRHFSERAKGGVPFEDGTKQDLSEHFAHVQAVKNLVGTAADLRDAGRPVTVTAAQVKLLGSDLAMRVTSDVVHWMGETGYSREGEVERLMRDVKALQIVEGTNQIQRLVLSREIAVMMDA